MERDCLAAMEAFVRAIEAGSFSGAAEQLHVDQPAVSSKTVAQLEDRLGVRLLRSTHGLRSMRISGVASSSTPDSLG